MRTLVTFMLTLLAVTPLWAQQSACLGWHNPMNFTVTGGIAVSSWTGMTGTKTVAASTCSGGIPWFSSGHTVTAADLASVRYTRERCSYDVQMQNPATVATSVDFNGQTDYRRRFVIKGAGTDPETAGGLSYLPPDTSFTSSIRLGNYCGDTQTEALIYQFQVTPYNALLTLWFAMSLQNGQHDAAHNPECVILVEKLTGNTWTRIGNGSLCRIQPAPIMGMPTTAPFYVGYKMGSTTYAGTQDNQHTSGANVYLPWTKCIIPLDQRYWYQTVRIIISAGDCAYKYHYAMVYIAGDCQPMSLTSNGCAAGESSAVDIIQAPTGMASYTWCRSRYGPLNNEQRQVNSNFEQILRARDDTLEVQFEHFIVQNQTTGAYDTVGTNTFMCIMQSPMNPDYPVSSTLFTEVNNRKPVIRIDSLIDCQGSITLTDRSRPIYQSRDSDLVDTSITVWEFYDSTTTDSTPVAILTGGTVRYQYANAGRHSIKVRTSAYDTTCWNKKTAPIRTIAPTPPIVSPERDHLCAGETISIYDSTPGSIYRQWHLYNDYGLDTTWEGSSRPDIRFTFTHTTTVSLTAHTDTYYLRDTNMDGTMDSIYCDATADTVIYVHDNPVIHISGDTIVCKGDQSIVTVSADINDCRFDWYIDTSGAPIQENTNSLTTLITGDVTYWVKATSPYGCVTYDKLDITTVKPAIAFMTPYYPKPEICPGDTARLWGGKAAYYTWTCHPDTDPTFWGQEGNDTIVVSPTETCVYTVTGHGTSGCSAAAMSQQIVVRPYPTLAVGLTPDYIDTDNSSVQFADLSEHGASSLWDFGDGQSSSIRTVVHTFTDLSRDSFYITLISANSLGCSRDTAFWIPVGIFSVWFPNAFTPSLATNKEFKAVTANILVDFELAVYDRHGLLLFYTTDPEQGWDGTTGGRECSVGSYAYISRYRRSAAGPLLQQKGTVLLLK